MIPPFEIIIRLLLGALLGGIIGFERELHGQAAGFRTQLLVCVAAVLIMIVSENYYYYLLENSLVSKNDVLLRIDPARIAAGAVIGIGFLGAGTIIKSGYVIKGLTTAASIWIVSAIGLSIGAGLYFEGVSTSFITMIALFLLRKIETKAKILQYRRVTVSAMASEHIEKHITAVMSECKITVDAINYERDSSKDEIVFIFSVSTKERDAFKDLFYRLGRLESVKAVRIGT